MTLVFPKKVVTNYKFSKEDILADIRKNLPEPWMWHYGHLLHKPSIYDPDHETEYDIVIMRNKVVAEDISIQRQFSTINNFKKSLYSIVIGIFVVEKLTWNQVCDTTFDYVTGAIEINSAAMLYDYIENIDNNKGGIPC